MFRWQYHPYGTTAFQAKSATINAVAKRYRYTGKERDEERGLYYHGARYYIPWLARWTAIDPMESKYAGRTPYCYGANNPVNYNDPTGNEEIKTQGTTSAGVTLDAQYHPAGLRSELSVITTAQGLTDVPYSNSNTGMGSFSYVHDSVNNQDYTILNPIGTDKFYSWVDKTTGKAEFFFDDARNKDANGKWTGEWVMYETAEQRIKREYGEEVLKSEAEAKQAMRTAAGFVPFVGGALDIGEGLRDGNIGQVASGSVGLAMDIFGGAILKAAATGIKSAIKMGTGGIVKTGAKEGAEIVTKEVTENVTKRNRRSN
ncbi:MAG: RHS repeat-associated core domain-containing protein [Chryseobacterium sp.]|nr:MAG: RHS repeat-associated core domain-containing protein [Chryseobacterium sp.]